jgi:hypothetical protein
MASRRIGIRNGDAGHVVVAEDYSTADDIAANGYATIVTRGDDPL